LIGIVADDITGANDIGLMFAKSGYRVEVMSHDSVSELNRVNADVIILDTNSRCDDPQIAYCKVTAATRRLLPLQCRLLIKKTCSVFRGNVGAEFDAMMEVAGAKFALVIAAFPRNGRITLGGQHYVHGRPLAESEFAADPLHPMKLTDLRQIIGQQSDRSLHLLDYQTVARGIPVIRKRIDETRAAGGYLVADVRSQEDLQQIAAAAADEPLIFGSSAIAEELPKFWPAPRGFVNEALPRGRAGILMIAGSLTPQTRAQVMAAREAGITTLTMDTRQLFDESDRRNEMARLIGRAEDLLGSGQDVLIHSAHQPEAIAETQTAARKAGLGSVAAGRIVSQSLGEIGRAIVDRAQVVKLIVAGGETSNDVCRSLGITGNLILGEIQPGLPSALSRGERRLLLVLKSGSFGSPDFLIRAKEHLNRL
jgi:uncharacterized protein YgbK (DUF1537 family)